MLRTALGDIACGPPLMAPPAATCRARLRSHRLRSGPVTTTAAAAHGKGGRQRSRKPARHPLHYDFESKAEELDDELEPVGMGLDPLDPPGTEKSESELRTCRALMLDSAYRPIRVVSWQRAICMDWVGKVDVLEYYPDMSVESASDAFPIPAVMKAHAYVHKNRGKSHIMPSRANILLRDRHMCQYCGTKESLTIDHVVPVSRGGRLSWENCVTACKLCNQMKGSQSLAALGWTPLKTPKEPTALELLPLKLLPKVGDISQVPPMWTDYILPWLPQSKRPQHAVA